MSAYIVNKETIDAILTYALSGRNKVGSCRQIEGDGYTLSSVYTPDEIGQALWNENYRSVNYRYSESDEPEVYVYTPRYKLPGRDGRYFAAIDIIKICQCLEYQSCEHDGWKDSFAKDFLDRVIDCCIRAIPGYDDAPWGL